MIDIFQDSSAWGTDVFQCPVTCVLLPMTMMDARSDIGSQAQMGKSRALWEAFQIQLAHVFRNDMKYDLMPQ